MSQADRAPTLTLILGLPGAGKSHYADTLMRHTASGLLVRFDSIRRALGHEYHKSTEPAVDFVACTMTRVGLMEGRDVVVDESITEYALASALVEIAREYGAKVQIVHVNTPVGICRANRVPHGFPEADFDRKVAEWGQDGARILGLGDAMAMQQSGVAMGAASPEATRAFWLGHQEER